MTGQTTRQTTNNLTIAGRVQPHSLEAEEHLLSCCLIDGNDTLVRCLGAGVTPRSFYAPANQLIFAALLDMHAAGLPIESGTLAEELKTAGTLDAIGGFAYLTQISGRIPTVAQAAYFADRVRELERLREIIRRGASMIELAFAWSGGQPLSVAFGDDIAGLSGVLTDQRTSRAWKDVVGEAKAITAARIAKKQDGSLFEVGWGFADLDQYFQKMEAGELVVLAARPSVGKSSMMRQVAYAAAARGEPALVSSLEVTDVEAAINLAANVSGVRSRRALDQLPKTDQAELLATFDSLGDLAKFAVCDQDVSLEELLARAKAFKARHRGLTLWVIDYLQLIADTKIPMRGERPDQAIGRVTSALKKFAVQERVTVMLLSQLNRAVEHDGNREPRLADLRDSGRIEEDANRVVFLHRPDEYALDGVTLAQSATSSVADEPRFFIKAIQAKGRNHGTAAVGLLFERQTATFKQVARRGGIGGGR